MKISKTIKVQKGPKIILKGRIWDNSQALQGAEIGEGCTIGHNCFIGSKAKLGKGVKIESNTDVWDYVTLEDYVFIGPSAVFTNDKNPRAKYPKAKYPEYGKWLPTLVKTGATIGANATIICGNIIGQWAIIGAGAVVADSVPDFAVMTGVPAKIIGWACECGNNLGFKGETAVCKICKRKYKKTGNQVNQIK